jgi:hypothetical protein
LDPLEDVEMGKKGSGVGVGDKKHGMKCKHPQCYKSLSLWLRWSEKGQAGTHGKGASSFDLRSERISHCGQISVPRLEKNIRISKLRFGNSDIQIRALHFHIRKPHAYIVVKIACLAIYRVYTLIQRIVGLRMYRRDAIYA